MPLYVPPVLDSPGRQLPSLNFFEIDFSSSIVKTFQDGGTKDDATRFDCLRDLRFLLRLHTSNKTTTAKVELRIIPLTTARMIIYMLWHCPPWHFRPTKKDAFISTINWNIFESYIAHQGCLVYTSTRQYKIDFKCQTNILFWKKIAPTILK